MSPWYRISRETLIEYGCHGLLIRHKNSKYELLKSVYPEHQWLPWQFKPIPKGLRNDLNVIQITLQFLENDQKLKTIQDWENLSKKTLQNLGMWTLVGPQKRLMELLRQFRPELYQTPSPHSNAEEDV